jgi:hypothetical protein
MAMADTLQSTLKKVGAAPHHDLLVGEANDILVVLPEEGFKDTADASRLTVAALREYAGKLGRRCGLVIIAGNLLAQEPESRRVYAENIVPDLFYGIAMVVNNPISRIIGNLGLRLGAMQVPITLVDTVEAGIAWLDGRRSQ